MAKNPELLIEIDEQGNVKIDALNFQGNACEKATADLERALGSVQNRKRKPEYRQKQVRNQRT